tara:strand:+ start:417 stop:620 length:204 start_codon:yes stop_codon:yes gene_type:complete
MDKNLEELLYITSKAYVDTSASSSSFARLGLIRQLLNEVDKMNIDDVARIKIKTWLENHQNKIEAEK